jgi:hypothetical protein
MIHQFCTKFDITKIIYYLENPTFLLTPFIVDLLLFAGCFIVVEED